MSKGSNEAMVAKVRRANMRREMSRSQVTLQVSVRTLGFSDRMGIQ